MRSRFKLVILSFLLFSSGLFANNFKKSNEPDVSWAHSPVWLKLYQYKKNFLGDYKSDINSSQFFFTGKPDSSPEEEARAAIEALKKKPSDACRFPAKYKTAAILSGVKVKNPKCVQLEEWLERLNFDSLSIVFAGAYPNNPASILGHSFLRLYNKAAEKKSPSKKLLSYSIGYAANADPRDSKVEYMFKGLSGGYPGFYKLEPYYMNVGIYNNAEDRDLWEEGLNYSPSEVEFLKLYLWELLSSAAIDYYFAGENCSYRILSFLDVVRPEVDLTNKLRWPVLPSESIRLLKDRGFTTNYQDYRSSIGKKLEYKLKNLNKAQWLIYKKAIKNSEAKNKVKDIKVLDALLDHWTYETYKSKGRLEIKKYKAKENNFAERASLGGKPQIYPNHAYFKKNLNLLPPYLGHRLRRLNLYNNKQEQSLDFHLGVHPLWMDSAGYNSFAAIDYLGLSYIKDKFTKEEKVGLKLIKIYTLNSVRRSNKKLSWYLNLGSSERMPGEDILSSSSQLSGALGYSLLLPYKVLAYGLIGVDLRITNFGLENSKYYNMAKGGLVYNESAYIFHLEFSHYLEAGRELSDSEIKLGRRFSDFHIFLTKKNSWGLDLTYSF